MADETLLELARQIRGKTLKLTEGVSPEQAMWAPPGLNNHIVWHAGHALILMEHLGIAPSTGQTPSYPDGWFEKFSWESKPATVRDWPKLEEVRVKLAEQLDRFLAIASSLSIERLAQPTSPRMAVPLRTRILHGFHDEAKHQGEIHLLKKLQAKGL